MLESQTARKPFLHDWAGSPLSTCSEIATNFAGGGLVNFSQCLMQSTVCMAGRTCNYIRVSIQVPLGAWLVMERHQLSKARWSCQNALFGCWTYSNISRWKALRISWLRGLPFKSTSLPAAPCMSSYTPPHPRHQQHRMSLHRTRWRKSSRASTQAMQMISFSSRPSPNRLFVSGRLCNCRAVNQRPLVRPRLGTHTHKSFHLPHQSARTPSHGHKLLRHLSWSRWDFGACIKQLRSHRSTPSTPLLAASVGRRASCRRHQSLGLQRSCPRWLPGAVLWGDRKILSH